MVPSPIPTPAGTAQVNVESNGMEVGGRRVVWRQGGEFWVGVTPVPEGGVTTDITVGQGED